MKKKELTLIFGHFEREHLGKDVFWVPFYLEKICDADATIVYSLTETNRDMPQSYRGVKLCALPQKDSVWFGFWCLLRHVWSIKISRFESFGIVLMESFRFRNYVLSANVGLAKEAISYGYGELVEQQDVDDLRGRLQKIIDGETVLYTLEFPVMNECFSWSCQLKKNIPWK